MIRDRVLIGLERARSSGKRFGNPSAELLSKPTRSANDLPNRHTLPGDGDPY
jgi:hypothetical protein